MTYKAELKNFKEQVKIAEASLARLSDIEYTVLNGYAVNVTTKDLIWVIEKARHAIVNEKSELMYH